MTPLSLVVCFPRCHSCRGGGGGVSTMVVVVVFPSEYLKTWEEQRDGGFRQSGITIHRVYPLNKK